MNCKPDQMAWITVPKHFAGSGLEQLNGHVVKTLRLDPTDAVPTWFVTPAQIVRFQTRVVDSIGRVIDAGDIGETDRIPDSFLRPFDPNSEPRNEPASRELEQTA